MDVHVFKPFFFRHFHKRVKVFGVAVHAAGGNKPPQVQFFAVLFHVAHYAQQFGVFKKFAVADFFRDFGKILIHDSARADIEVPDFGIAHLPVGKPHGHTACAQRGRGVFFFQFGYVFASVGIHGVALVFRV